MMIDTAIVSIDGTDHTVRVVDIATATPFAASTWDVTLVDGRKGRVVDAAFTNKWERSNA